MPDSPAEFGNQSPIKESEKRVAELYEKGLNSENIIGFHGTSIESLLHLAEHGRLPPGFIDPGFYFAPINNVQSFEEAYDRATAYANWSGWIRYVIPRILPFLTKPLTADEIKDLIFKGGKGLYDLLGGKITPGKADKLWGEANKREGAILTLSSRLADDFEIKPSPDESEPNTEKVIEASEGLPIEYIEGIEPEGDYEWKVLEELQKRVTETTRIIK